MTVAAVEVSASVYVVAEAGGNMFINTSIVLSCYELCMTPLPSQVLHGADDQRQ